MIRCLLLTALTFAFAPSAFASPGDLRSAEPVSSGRGLLADRPLPGLRKASRGSSSIPQTLEGYNITPFASRTGALSALAVYERAGGVIVFAIDAPRGRITRFEDRAGDGASDQAGTYISGLSEPSGLRVYGDALYYTDARGLWRAELGRGLSPASPPERLVDLSGADAAAAPRPFDLINEGQIALIGFNGGGQTSSPLGQAIIAVDLASGQAEFFAQNIGGIQALRTTPTGQVLALSQQDGVAQIRVFTAQGQQSAALDFEPGGGPSDIMLTPQKIVKDSDEDLGQAWVAFSGADNNGRGGYHVSALSFTFGAPKAEYRVMIDGFTDAARRGAWGRPRALAALPNGDILIADDWSGTIWRFSKAPIAPKPQAEPKPDSEPVIDDAREAQSTKSEAAEEPAETASEDIQEPTRIRLGGSRRPRESNEAPSE